MALNYKCALLASLLTLSFTTAAEITPLKPEPGQSTVIKEVLDKLASSHYRKRPMDDTFSTDLYDAYLKRLDGWKSYFLESDIDEFGQWRLDLDNALKRGELSHGFAIFNRYRTIALKQLADNISLLESADFEFNFDDQEFIPLDSELRHWPKSFAERNDWWRKRMEYELLRIILSGDETPAKAREILAKRYKNDRKRIEEMKSDDVFNLYAESITRLYDPHTLYFSPRNSENFNINMSLSLEGIGAVLERKDDYIQVVRVVPGGPAAKQGELQAGDKIIGIAESEDADPTDLIGWRLDDAVDLIRGPKNSTAVLKVIPAKASSDAATVIKIVRDEVKLEEQGRSKTSGGSARWRPGVQGGRYRYTHLLPGL